jgi:hypothetical protein
MLIDLCQILEENILQYSNNRVLNSGFRAINRSSRSSFPTSADVCGSQQGDKIMYKMSWRFVGSIGGSNFIKK